MIQKVNNFPFPFISTWKRKNYTLALFYPYCAWSPLLLVPILWRAKEAERPWSPRSPTYPEIKQCKEIKKDILSLHVRDCLDRTLYLFLLVVLFLVCFKLQNNFKKTVSLISLLVVVTFSTSCSIGSKTNTMVPVTQPGFSEEHWLTQDVKQCLQCHQTGNSVASSPKSGYSEILQMHFQ